MGASRWVTTIGTLAVAGILVRQLNVRVEGLIDELDANAHTTRSRERSTGGAWTSAWGSSSRAPGGRASRSP